MSNYNIKKLKTLTNILLFLVFLTLTVYALEDDLDWTKPLKPCWAIKDVGYNIASDNNKENILSDNLIIFSNNSIKNLNTISGNTIWESEINGQTIKTIILIEKNLFVAVFSLIFKIKQR